MKRTSKLKLTLMLGAGVGLSGCGESDESALLFKDVDDCEQWGVERFECEVQYQEALANHYIEAPKYTSESNCESDFGFDQCERDNNSIWRPIMAGFMIGLVAEAVDEALDYAKKKKRKKYAHFGGSSYGGSKPLYRAKDDFFSFRNSNNQTIGSINNRGSIMVKKSKVKFTSKPKSISRSRGGFGSRASSRSYGG